MLLRCMIHILLSARAWITSSSTMKELDAHEAYDDTIRHKIEGKKQTGLDLRLCLCLLITVN